MKSGSAANGRRSKQSQQHGAVGGDLYNIDDLTVREFFYTVCQNLDSSALFLLNRRTIGPFNVFFTTLDFPREPL